MSGKKSTRRTKKNSRNSSGAASGSRGRNKNAGTHQHKNTSHKGKPAYSAVARAKVQQKAEESVDEPTVILLFNKPFQVLCQFTDQDDRETLASYIKIPKLYAAGRLDRDSEGLLLLTNNGMLQHRISHPDFKLPKTYLVQLEGDVSSKAIRQLCDGVKLNDGPTAPAEVKRVEPPEWLWPRNPPIRVRKDIPTSWIRVTITEGRNRQVRRMTAAVSYPTLRLIRTHIGGHCVTGIEPGEYKEVADTLG